MKNKTRFLLVGLCICLLTQSVFAFGWGGPRPWGGGHRAHFREHGMYIDALPFAAATLLIAGAEYYYWQGEYYRRDSQRYVVVSAPVGAIVPAVPTGYQPVIIDGVTYYLVNGVTYMYTPNGYQVVPQPRNIVVQNDTVVSAPTVALPVSGAQSTAADSNSTNAFTVNIPNSKGGYSPVVLKRSGTGFVGPQGEYYTEFPRLEQLKVMYAK